jgi:RNA polymerase sigma-70 factor (sigma-E family)
MTESMRAIAGVPARARMEELYAQQVAPLGRLAYLLTGDRHLAEDITQQAFVRFYGRFMNLRDRSAAAAYLRRTVVNLARGHHRRSSHERALLQRERGPERLDAPRVEDHDLLIRAIRQLPHRQRAAIVLRFFEDLSERDAADVLDCSTDAIKSLTARAMTTLRKITEGALDDR